MNLKEIVLRSDSQPINQDEALFIIQQYIKIRKGKEITPFIETRYDGTIIIMHELQLMGKMVVYAIAWLRGNYALL